MNGGDGGRRPPTSRPPTSRLPTSGRDGGARRSLASSPGGFAPSAPRPGSLPGVTRPLTSPARASDRAPPLGPPQAGPAEGSGPAPSRSAPLVFSLGARVADAYLALAGLAYLEVYTVGFLSLKQFVGPFELGQASQGLVPVALVAAAPAALAGGALVELLRRGEGPRARVAVGVLAAAFAGAVGWGAGTGRHLEGGLRVPFAAGVAALAGAVAYALAPRVARVLLHVRGAGRAAVFLLGTIGLLALAGSANVLVLPRLYPAFHLGLAAVGLLLGAASGLALRALDQPRPGSILQGSLLRGAAAAAVFALGAARAPAAAKRLARLDNVRVIYLERAPLLAHVVEIAAAISPPAPLDDGPDPSPPPGAAGAHTVDFTGRDILLVTVDALRADHVGAYGYKRPTTPNLDRLAEGGVVFDAAYSPTPHTSYAVTSLMTGKYMRPLVLQGLGGDSETWAGYLRRYGYRTAAFYPPAVFFIDAERFVPFRDRALDFEYRRVEFAPAAERAAAVKAYLDKLPPGRRVFLWVHLFEPHEPYEAHSDHPFGDRDVDRYDSEIAAADDGIGAVVATLRAARPNAVVIATADHGEEFSEHGGRYHGTTVYEEQVRVPLVINAPGLLVPHRVSAPVQLVDLLPTVLEGLSIPRPARVRGADLGPYLAAPDGVPSPAPDAASPSPGPHLPGFAFAETDAQTLLARGPLRLVCARKVGACVLYDVDKDPGETTDVSGDHPGDLSAMRAELRTVEASHGRYEKQGLRAEGKGWPEALRRGLAGDGDAATDVAALLDDADVAIRRKAAEVLFELGRADASAQIRLALVRDEDDEVRRWCALALTRLGEGAPRVRDLLQDRDARWRKLAALTLAEGGDDRGADVLVAWWREAYPARPEPTPDNPSPKTPVPRPIPFERAREIAAALGKIRSRAAVVPLIDALDDVRLRPYLARALASIGDEAARPALAARLRWERYQIARVAVTEALVKLGAGPELRAPLVRFLGTPDPLPDGLRFAQEAKILDLVGGPRALDRDRLRHFATSGVAVGMVVPRLTWKEQDDCREHPDAPPPGCVHPDEAAPPPPLRVLCRARSTDGRSGEIRAGLRAGPPPAKLDHESLVPSRAPEIDPATMALLAVPAVDAPVELFATLPAAVKVKPGEYGDFVVYATHNVEVLSCAVVPLAPELPPPPPVPWAPVVEDGAP